MITHDQITQVLTALTPVANKLAVGSQTVFGWAVKNAIADGIFLLLISLFLGAILFWWVVIVRKAYKEEKMEEIWPIFMGIGCACILIAIPFLIGNGVKELLSPQYYAFQSLLDTAKGK